MINRDLDKIEIPDNIDEFIDKYDKNNMKIHNYPLSSMVVLTTVN